MNLFADIALIDDGWAKNVRVTLDNVGKINKVESGIEKNNDDQYLRNRILLPALSNLHSHSFQRAMAGLTEKRLSGKDSFWSWRKLMHKFLECLTPERIEVIALLVFMEMLECGYASVGEFHYLHHQQGGNHYLNIAENSCRIVSAAERVGIGLTILPVFYTTGVLNGETLSNGERRFLNEFDQYLSILSKTQDAIKNVPKDYLIGVAPHSLRTVPPVYLKEITEARSSGPIHIHIAEQVKEVEFIESSLGARPVEWLLNNVNVDSRWCTIHATHMTKKETKNLAKSGAVVGLCPITEANLGDGIFDGRELLLSGGRYGIGSDSNIRVSLTEELRLLEYSQRLSRKERNLMTNKNGSVGLSLYKDALIGGCQALGRKSGSIAEGNWADLITLNSETLELFDCFEDEFLDRWIFTGNDSLVREVWSAGRLMVVDGIHIHHKKIEKQFRKVISEIRKEK